MSEPEKVKTAAELEAEQEEMLRKKYGGLQPKKKLLPKDHKYFDSADWALAKENKAKGDAAKLEEQLPPKLEPTPAPLRRVSQLDHCNH